MSETISINGVNYVRADSVPETRPTGNLGRDPLVMNEGRVQRGNGSGGPTTPKPDIIPKPQPAGGRLYRGGLYRIKGSDIWYPIGTEPNWTELAQDQVRQRTPNPPPMEP